jgi:hypothetical protein
MRNTGIPPTLVKTFYSLVAIMAFGVAIPITIQALSISDKLNTWLTLTSVALVLTSIFNFVLDFVDILHEDVHVK